MDGMNVFQRPLDGLVRRRTEFMDLENGEFTCFNAL